MSELSPEGTLPAAARPLTPIERRILGVLVEKALTTPDGYPLTANSVVTACNQKSNRDPVTNYQAHEVDDTLLRLKETGLTTQVFSATGRTERWKHHLKEGLGIDRPEMSVLAELFLRGHQSEGDLRARASRMTPMASLEDLRAILGRLAEKGFVRRLSPEGRRRGVIWGHLFLQARELAHLDEIASREEAEGDDAEEAISSVSTTSGPSTRDQLMDLIGRVANLETRLAELEARLGGNS